MRYVFVALVACSGAQHRADQEAQQFNCRERSAAYIATKHIGGDEIGVQMDCADAGPRVKRWRTDKSGKHDEDAHGITPGQFDRTWREIDGTGWPNLRDCGN